ncbi:condensation domain-containing protein [Nocardia sp. NPDC050799]|uniref:condensation domain-containing protein n=1 Tax=Nocardia sp. NPDC050799 TaxID=3154842 RepID=UPI0033D7A4BA
MNDLTDARLELLRRRLAATGAARHRTDRARTEAGSRPASAGRLGTAERRMWKIYELDPDSISHNIGLILDFDRGYDLDTVIAAFDTMVGNAEVLGSVVTVDDEGVPRRVPARRDGRWVVPGTVWEWGTTPGTAASAIPAADSPASRAEIHAAATAFATVPLRLTAEPPLRARIHANADGRVTVVLVVHHLAVDDTSWPLLLGTLVSGTWPGAAVEVSRMLPPEAARPDEVDRAVRHALRTWAAEDIRFPLSGALPEISAADSWLSPLVDSRGERLRHPIEPADIAALEGIAREVGATPNALYIAVCGLTVYALTGAADHVLLVPADNRRAGEGPDRIGYSGNIIPMRFTFVPGTSVQDALRAAVSSVYESMEFSSVDYGTVLTALRAAGGRFPVAEIMASVRNAPLRGIRIPDGVHVTCESVFNGVGNYPLTFAFEIGDDARVHLEVDYQPAVVDDAFARRATQVVDALLKRVPLALDTAVDDLVRVVAEPQNA